MFFTKISWWGTRGVWWTGCRPRHRECLRGGVPLGTAIETAQKETGKNRGKIFVTFYSAFLSQLSDQFPRQPSPLSRLDCFLPLVTQPTHSVLWIPGRCPPPLRLGEFHTAMAMPVPSCQALVPALNLFSTVMSKRTHSTPVCWKKRWRNK